MIAMDEGSSLELAHAGGLHDIPENGAMIGKSVLAIGETIDRRLLRGRLVRYNSITSLLHSHK